MKSLQSPAHGMPSAVHHCTMCNAYGASAKMIYTLYYYTEGDRSAETLKSDYVIYGQPLIRRKYHSHDDNICNNGSFLEFFIGRDAISAVHGPYMMRGNM